MSIMICSICIIRLQYDEKYVVHKFPNVLAIAHLNLKLTDRQPLTDLAVADFT